LAELQAAPVSWERSGPRGNEPERSTITLKIDSPRDGIAVVLMVEDGHWELLRGERPMKKGPGNDYGRSSCRLLRSSLAASSHLDDEILLWDRAAGREHARLGATAPPCSAWRSPRMAGRWPPGARTMGRSSCEMGREQQRILSANSLGRSPGRSLGELGCPANGKSPARGPSTEFADSIACYPNPETPWRAVETRR
jgi:hypothetical protein